MLSSFNYHVVCHAQAILSIDRVIEYNDTDGNGKFDEQADNVLSYYGAQMHNLSSFRSAEGQVSWHGNFDWEPVHCSEGRREVANGTGSKSVLESVTLNISTSTSNSSSSVGILSVDVIQQAHAETMENKVRVALLPHLSVLIITTSRSRPVCVGTSDASHCSQNRCLHH